MFSFSKKRSSRISYDGKVPVEQEQRLRRKLNELDITVCFKEDGYKVWWHYIVAWFVMAFFWVQRQVKPDSDISWMHYVTTLGSHIYFPTRDGFDMRDFDDWCTCWHEMKHVMDSRDNPVWYELSYVLFPLPVYWTMRAYWEYRGYAISLWAMHQLTGTLTGYYYDWERGDMAEEFSSWNYGKMDPGKDSAEKKLRKISDTIEDGDLSFDDMSGLPWREFALGF